MPTAVEITRAEVESSVELAGRSRAEKWGRSGGVHSIWKKHKGAEESCQAAWASRAALVKDGVLSATNSMQITTPRTSKKEGMVQRRSSASTFLYAEPGLYLHVNEDTQSLGWLRQYQ